jgi:hypothetical protein
MPKLHPDPGPLPPDATPKQREQHRRAEERFLTEGGKAGASDLPANVDPTDRRLALLRKDQREFLRDRNPLTSALWLALLRPTSEVIHDAEQTRRFVRAQAGLGNLGEVKTPRHAAIVEIGNQLVANAINGDTTAIERIAERIEGKVGTRPGDEDPQATERAKQSELVVASLVDKLTKGRLQKETVIDVKAETVEEGEAK